MGKKPGKDRSIEHVNRTSGDLLKANVALTDEQAANLVLQCVLKTI